MRRVGVVMGGSSGEREVSLRSGAAVAAALADRGHAVVPVVLGDNEDVATALAKAKIDAAFLALHGRYGEDGCVQAVCELLGVPYTGSSVLSSALAMDKVKAKELFRLHNVPTPPYYTLTAESARADLEETHGSFGFPVMVKPRSEGSSLGLSRATSMAELARGIDVALGFDDVVLVERFITGREITVGILDGRVLGAVEVAPKSGVYDFEAKYTPGRTDYFQPARVPATRLRGILNLAERAAKALDCTGAVRVDLLVTEGENEYVLEVNTLPGMTETSLLPKIASAAGYDFGALCEAILDGARLHQGAARSRGASRASRIELAAEAAPTSLRRVAVLENTARSARLWPPKGWGRWHLGASFAWLRGVGTSPSEECGRGGAPVLVSRHSICYPGSRRRRTPVHGRSDSAPGKRFA